MSELTSTLLSDLPVNQALWLLALFKFGANRGLPAFLLQAGARQGIRNFYLNDNLSFALCQSKSLTTGAGELIRSGENVQFRASRNY